MAQRRMFSPQIVGSDAFLEMPVSSRELYFQLGMYADDDGFISPRKVMRMAGAGEDDLKMLITRRFVLPFENGVVVIKHWMINNLIRKDFYRPTQYVEQKQLLLVKENKAYTLDEAQGSPLLESRKQIVNNPLPQVRLGKVRLGNKQLAETAYSFDEELRKLQTSKREDLAIIGKWIECAGLAPANEKQFQALTRRNLRPAKALCGYSLKDIEYTISVLKKTSYLTKFTLETVGKYIDDMIGNRKKNGPRIVDWVIKDNVATPIYEK